MQTVVNEANPIMAPHWKLTVEDYHHMAEVGIFHEDDRVELIEIEVYTMPEPGLGHYADCRTVTKGQLFPALFPDANVDVAELLS